MTTICLAIPVLQCFVTTPLTAGYSSQYAPHIMQYTIEARQGWNHLPDDLSQYTVFAATAECDDIGREFLISYDGGYERGIVTDCSNIPETKAWFADNLILLEVDGDTAARWGIVGRGGIPVSMAYVLHEVAPGYCGVVAL